MTTGMPPHTRTRSWMTFELWETMPRSRTISRLRYGNPAESADWPPACPGVTTLPNIMRGRKRSRRRRRSGKLSGKAPERYYATSPTILSTIPMSSLEREWCRQSAISLAVSAFVGLRSRSSEILIKLCRTRTRASQTLGKSRSSSFKLAASNASSPSVVGGAVAEVWDPSDLLIALRAYCERASNCSKSKGMRPSRRFGDRGPSDDCKKESSNFSSVV